MVLAFGFVYMIVNLVATKVRGKPIYAPIDWETFTGYISPFVIGIVSIIMHLGLSKINRMKLRASGYGHILDRMSNKVKSRAKSME